MTVVERKPVPIYETTCNECRSKIRYKKCEVSSTGYITCPVCGVSLWGKTMWPVEMANEGE